MPVGEPYDNVRVGSRVRLVGGTEALVVRVRKRERALLTGRLTPPLFDIVDLDSGMRVAIHGSAIEEVLAYEPDSVRAEDVPPPREPLSLRAAAARVRNERAAIDAVRRSRNATTREQQRGLLESELKRRQLVKTPVWIEAKLDTLEAGYKAPSTIGALTTIGKLVVDGIDNVKHGHMPGEEDPAWMAPPFPAKYDVLLAIGERVRVELDPDAQDWLDRAYDAATYRIGTTVTIKVWLDWASDPKNPQPSLAGAIGARRVGVLAATPPFIDLMGEAAAVEKLPVTDGHLTRRSALPLYVLEVPNPDPRGYARPRVRRS